MHVIMANRLVDIVSAQAKRYGSREAYRFCWRKDGEWQSTSWNDFGLQVEVAGKALARIGLIEKDTIAICSPNTPQILITELGGFRNRLSAIPIYANSSQDQFDFIVNNGGAKVLFVGDSHQYPLAYNHWKKNPDSIKKIVVFKNDELKLEADDTVTIFWDDFVRMGMEASDDVAKEVEARSERGLPEDMATLIYTSGTTGEPKGVVISHANYDAAIETHIRLLKQVKDTDLSMAFLPMSHILEKAWCYYCISRGVAIAVNYDPRVIQDTIHDVHPNLMCCVPRFWEKVYAAVKEKIATMSKMQRMMVDRAIRCGRKRNLDYKRLGKRVPWFLEKEYQFWDKNIFRKLKMAIGIPEPNMFPTAGAPLSDRIVEFMRSVGIEVTIGYGLSETTATVSYYPPVGYEIGTVGIPLPGLSVRIDKNGEILVKGPTVTAGYYMNEEANLQAFTDDGYFRTGDAGYFTESGALVLTERVKDLFKTSNGKYIAPQMLESRLAENKYIDEAAVIGDQRKFVTALIVPNLSQLRAWASQNGIPSDDTEKFVSDPKVVAFMMEQINGVQYGLAEYEKIKRITLLPHHFSIMNGEVTNTMKVRRPVVAKRYSKEIEAMYAY
ncbi:long-chain fatty acid--CoA ligase [Muribaculaceae bacterium Isolate-037 (Harlan)]|jgi:long-chain acyl-CoA synthetase|uniref:Long-chain fatty acid--CoA ligase n=1 Tax=Lepagella muris TaxID=3032870 RepID=A0AC61RFB0_9BACT|nr:long-chain fatty acid--CoA ligase [Muribaculaceae bacterium Isolate-037 (Harlan)]TGY78589.1 long-chain fatty acid--CoA ligase [Lepagella muris]THG52043.1 long-chain fatty acid--CoA ligase [Bacteroidales bacterium]TKC54938.1 long-chain fatty acid--CoA ligase [Bacteroidales bacterium]